MAKQRLSHRRPRVVALLTDGMWSHDVANIIQVFGSSLALGGECPCDLSLVAEGDSVLLDHGITVPCTPLSLHEGSADLVCVPGFCDPFALNARFASEEGSVTAWTAPDAPRPRVPREMEEWICGQWASGAELVALGTGTYLLAIAGLLDGVACTTHWLFAEQLARFFPRVRVDASRLLTFDRRARIRTSAGGAAGADVCLAALADVAGYGAASIVACAMNLWSPRSPDTRQDALGMPAAPEHVRAIDGIEQLKDAVRRHMDHGWTVTEMAWYLGMSVRTFQRRFEEAEGQTPSRWLAAEQVVRAAQLLEDTEFPLPVIAARVGLGGTDALRRRFTAAKGESPSAYRRRFRALRSNPPS